MNPLSQHFLFTHRFLPLELWDSGGLIGILASPDQSTFLTDGWNHISEWATTRGAALDAVDPTGLSYDAWWIADEHLVFVVHLPEPRHLLEAYFVAIATSPRVRYFALEMLESAGGEPELAFAEIDEDARRKKGHSCYFGEAFTTKSAFLGMVCDELGVPRRVEPASVPTLEVDALDSDVQERIDTWFEEAERAEAAHDLSLAASNFNRIIETAQDAAGPGSRCASRAMRGLAGVLRAQGELLQEEDMRRRLWRLCRRWRIPGHRETLQVIKDLADLEQRRGRIEEAERLLQDGAWLARAARGTESMEYQDLHGMLVMIRSFGD